MKKINRNVHVTPKKGGSGWVVQTGGQIISEHRTQVKAADSGKIIAKIKQSELVTHGKDGVIKSKDSYGNDPFPPRDTEY